MRSRGIAPSTLPTFVGIAQCFGMLSTEHFDKLSADCREPFDKLRAKGSEFIELPVGWLRVSGGDKIYFTPLSAVSTPYL